jgi:hypothetical protein
MKKLFCLLLILCLCAPGLGCQTGTEKIDAPASFYYRRNEIGYWSESSVIQKETRDISGLEHTPNEIIALYLKGPASDALLQIFPTNTRLLSLDIAEGATTLHISDDLHQLSGIDLSIACVSLAMTTMELTGAETVRIQTDAMFSDGTNTKTFDRNCMILWDNSADLIYESDRSGT